jgi:hypothetical protein
MNSCGGGVSCGGGDSSHLHHSDASDENAHIIKV